MSQVNNTAQLQKSDSGRLSGTSGCRATERAFTLIELLAILLTLALFASVLWPAYAKSGLSSKGFQCLNNNRQLCAAWLMYAGDNRDRVVYASDDSHTGYCWTYAHMDFNANNRGNWDTNFDITIGPLWPYTARNASIYKCPSDPSYVTTTTGTVRPRVRTMNMNLFVGGIDGTDGGFPSLTPYRVYATTAQFSAYGGSPAQIFVFTDERHDLVNWGNFLVDMSGYDPRDAGRWEFNGDMPGMYHDRAGSFSFADGHCEMKRWQDPRTTPPYFSTLPSPYASPANPDVYWLQDHTTRRK